MELLAVIAGLAFIGIAAFFFLENGKLHKRIVALDQQLREGQSKKPVKAAKSDEPKAAVETVIKSDPELERDLDDARFEIKDLKKQIYDLKKGSKELKQEVKEAREDRGSDVPDSDLMFDLREEIADLKAENARLEDAAKSAKKSPRAEAPAPKREEPAPTPVAAAAPSGNEDLDALRAKFEKEISTLKQEARDLDRKLKSTASNVDKQRRRADNNDRAYKITQRQYDAAQERVELLEAQLKKAGFGGSAEPAKPAAAAKPAAPAKPSAPAAPAKPAIPAKPAADKPKPEVGSTTVLSAAALAGAVTGEPDAATKDDSAEATGGNTLTNAKSITVSDIAAAAEAKAEGSKKEEPQAAEDGDLQEFDSGGHTAMLTPGALAKSVGTPAEENEPAADESGGHTEVLSQGALSKAVTVESVSADSEAEFVPREAPERTSILSPGAFAKDDEAGEPAVADEPELPVLKKDEPDGGRRPSANLFGMPADLLSSPPAEDEDPARTTQFAFPTQMADEPAASQFARVESSGRIEGIGVGENPADKPIPDADSDATPPKQENRLGGRLGDLDLGDLNSAIDDAWSDLDVD